MNSIWRIWPTATSVVTSGQRDSGRWTWRYDLAEVDGKTDVTLTYDWSNATPEARERVQFPPFGVDKLAESLDNLATLAT